MRGYQIYVQSTSKLISLRTHVRLFLAATALQRTQRTRLDLKEPDCEGRVTTSWEFSNIGGIAGTLFEAEIDAEEGSTCVSFIVREIDMETARQFLESGVPMVDLFPFLDAEGGESIDRYAWN